MAVVVTDPRGDAWSREEVEATVNDYLQMLTAQFAGQTYNKTEHRGRLAAQLNNRTEGSIEFKHCNISAILIELGCPYIIGYKRRDNFQRLLFEVVVDRVAHDSLFDQAAIAAVELPAFQVAMPEFVEAEVPPPTLEPIEQVAREPGNDTVDPWDVRAFKRDYGEREAHNRSLGKAGELFVVDFEKWRLRNAGFDSLANKVEHVADTRGDGLGFDILSFDDAGHEQLIEVKTTSFGQDMPFFVTKTELDTSAKEANRFQLCRVFEFRRRPRLFRLHGEIGRHCHLDPVSYRATFC